jgi:hypothetical protein
MAWPKYSANRRARRLRIFEPKEQMISGICQLCDQHEELVSSHLIPRAIYDYCRSDDSEPILLTSKIVMQTSRQLQYPLLCQGCELLLNKGGEDWLLPLLATIDQRFPLLDIIERNEADLVDGDLRGYAAARNSAIDVDKLLHFAMGVFWKASIHSWRGGEKSTLIDLGPYRESVWIFLRGDSEFPKYMGLVAGVLPRDKALIGFCQPYRGSSRERHNFLFHIPGLQFCLSVGKGLGDEMPSICFATNPAHPILVADLSRDIAGVVRRVTLNPHKSRRLVEYLATKKRN